MTPGSSLARPHYIVLATAFGLYASAVALLPAGKGALALAAPLIVIALGWWTLLTPVRWLYLLLGAALLLPPLPLPLGDSGPHPALLFGVLGLLAGMLRLADWKLRLDGLGVAILVYYAALVASIPMAVLYSGVAVAAASLSRLALAALAPYVFFYMTSGPGRAHFDPWRTTRLLFWAGTASAVFACLDFYYQFPAPAGFSAQFVWLDSGVFRRAQGLFYDASALGNVCAFFLVMIAAAFVRPPEKKLLSKPVLLASSAVFLTALIASYSRASLMNLVAAGVAMTLLRTHKSRRRHFATALLLSGAVAVAILSYAFPAFAGPYWLRIQASLQYFFTSPEGVLSGRVGAWQTILGLLAQHPWYALLGVGYKTLPYTTLMGRPVIADNMYLSMLAETGVIGLAALVVFSLAVLRSAWRAARSHDRTAAFFGTWMFCFWVGQMFQMLSGDLLTYWRALPLYFWAMAAVKVTSDERPFPGSVQ